MSAFEGVAEDVLATTAEPQRNVFRELLEGIRSQGVFSVAVHGSVCHQETDRFSDIDVTLVYADDMCQVAAFGHFEELVQSLGVQVVSFRADHISGLSETMISYLCRENWIIKLDAAILPKRRLFTLPHKTIIVYDPVGRISGALRSSEQIPVASELLKKLVGWIWFTYARLARGELFSAMRALDFSREHALLPLILARKQHPQDGHRRIEKRLNAEELYLLRRTHPLSLSRAALLLALQEMSARASEELDRADCDTQRDLKMALDTIWGVIEAEERAGMRVL